MSSSTSPVRRRPFLALLAATVAGSGCDAWGEEFWGRKLRQPTQFLFGYGSLVNSASRDMTAAAHVVVPARIAATFGHVRAWNDRSASGFTALGLRPARAGEAAMTINGVLYPAEGDDLAAFDAREAGYRRIEIPRAELEAVSWQGLPPEGQIWAYMPKEDNPPDENFPLLQSYIDVVVEGGFEYAPEFAREIVLTTAGWSPYWLNDRRLARRPWVFDRLYQQVDELLAAQAPYFADRRFPETYGGQDRQQTRPSAAAPTSR